MTGLREAESGYRSFELWLRLPPAENDPEGDDWEVTHRFTFRNGASSA